MTTMICPMLSALSPVDENGQPVNRECIYESCRFFNREQKDCNLMLGTRATFGLADKAAGPEAAETQGVIRQTGQTILDRIAALETTTTNLAAALARLETQVAAIIDVQEKVADRLLEEMSLIQAGSQKKDAKIADLGKSIAGIADDHRQVVRALETQQRRVEADQVDRNREEAVTCNNRGVALYYRGAFEAARNAFRRALELVPDYAEAFNNLGLVLSRLGSGNEAVEAFRQALKIDPKMGEAFNNLGFMYHANSQYDRAAQMFGQALENAADSSIAYTNLGNTFYAMEQPDKAVEAWRRAAELDPLNENALRGLRMFQQDAANN